MSETPKTLRELIVLGDAYLRGRAVPDARTVCELLAARLFNCGRLELYRYLDAVPQTRVVDALRRGLRRVADGEPVQYVLGRWEFRDLTLKVDRRALIPRPETEQLVDLVLASRQISQTPKPLVVDVGTGSGCIILSLARALRDGVFVGLDVSVEALALARENATLTGLAERVLFAESEGCGEFDPASVDVLVSNPPYIPSQTVDGLERHIRDHEPRLALDGGPDGLRVYRALLLDAVMVLKAGGGVFFEIGDDQGPALRTLLEEHGFSEVAIHRDYAGRDRFAVGVLND
ncbi:MAG: peptide chain release factor N(5)-glutamine methyltransferase [Kiritimatiellae bacterium]|jgi:release factor glutamine methyltransferase|nr:peptide chain release factor N(5)-glutamine methyltransferase [Kiritimatiellia bacterium]NLF98589.1 peptide chain release factor N(5)-glutamine methyltransferase [Lentisphaerota bacterium]